MNTKIGTSFGLAMLMVIGVIATMFALGTFTAKPASALIGVVEIVSSPTTAGATAQHTVTVTGSGTQQAITVGGSITVTFDSKFTVPSAIAASAVKIKADNVSGAGTINQLVSVGAVTVSGRAITLTIPDMDQGTAADSLGDNSIDADAKVTITFTQAAGIVNPKLAVAANTRSVTLKSSADTIAVTSTSSSAVTGSVTFTPTTAARGATVAVSGKGFAANCSDCKVRFNPQNSVTPTTGNEGSGSIDASGVFTGTFTVDSSTNKVDYYVWVVDSTGTGKAGSTQWVQKAGATPRATTVSPGGTVTVDLVDYTATATFADPGAVNLGGVTTSALTGVTTVPTGGSSATLTPFKFVVPTSHPTGTHLVTITEQGAGTKSATFNIDVTARVLTVTPATASPGQSITISGTGFDKSSGIIEGSTVNLGALTAVSNGGTAYLNHAVDQDISIDATGAWSYATRMPTLEDFNDGTSTSVTISASDGTVTGSSSGFKRTARTVVLSPTTAGPGQSVTVSVTGMTVDNGENTTTATFTVSGLAFTGTATFPVGSDGSGTGVVTIPTGTAASTVTIVATDNADALNEVTVALLSTTNRTASASLKIPNGTITVSPASASTGNIVTVVGSNFPPNTTGSVLTFGSANGIPSGGYLTDANGGFTVSTEIPAATAGGSLPPGSAIVLATVGSITGSTTAFSVPSPTITITPAEASVEDTIVITGSGFNSLGTASVLTIGSASAMPSPAPRASRNGDIETSVVVPLLNPGAYTVTLTNGTGFSASATFTATAAKATPAASTDQTETVFADVIANDDNLVRVWRFSNADQSWSFFDPRPAFAAANTLAKTGAGDIVWVNVNTEESFQSGTLFPGWNLISLK